MNFKSGMLLLILALATASTAQAKTTTHVEPHAEHYSHTQHTNPDNVQAKQHANPHHVKAKQKVAAKKSAVARAKAQKSRAHLIAHQAKNKAVYNRYSSYKNDHRYYWNGTRWVLHARYR
jgi:hypothetical protein